MAGNITSAAAYQSGLARHRAGAQATVNKIVALGGLRAGLAPERAAAMLASLTEQSVYRSLIGTYGWSFDETQEWLVEILSHQLVSPG
jgi:hypothetical protein